MASRPTVASMWIGNDLTFMEQLCLKSFVDAGHPTKLYTYEPVGNVPDGVEIADASSIMPSSAFVVNQGTGSPGPHADKFRYHMLDQTDEIWVDTDAYCRKPFPDQPFVFASHWGSMINNGVFRLPRGSKTLQDLLDFTATDFPDLPEDFLFKRKRIRERYFRRKAEGRPMHVGELWWEVWGPHPVTYFLKKNNERRHALDRHLLYPYDGSNMTPIVKTGAFDPSVVSDDCLSIHFFGSAIRRLLEAFGGVPEKGSYMALLCAKHRINPEDAPMLAKQAAA